MPSSTPYFNPPTVSSTVTQTSDVGANSAASDNFVLDAHNAPTPNFGPAVNPHMMLHRQDSAGHFDWDQWDAVFGQHMAVVDPMMDMDWEESNTTARERKDDMDLYDNS
jgi:hypothetical protein